MSEKTEVIKYAKLAQKYLAAYFHKIKKSSMSYRLSRCTISHISWEFYAFHHKSQAFRKRRKFESLPNWLFLRFEA
jgi:hypothetical protein